jgi:hypothetical protein
MRQRSTLRWRTSPTSDDNSLKSSNGTHPTKQMPHTTARSSRLCRERLFAFALTVISLVLAFQLPAQDLARRLILKDGSYQLVTKYEVKGDRVRYLSAERNEWEELPSSLIDWPATERYEKDRSTSAVPEAAAIDKETDAEREAEQSRLPQVAPGLRLPDDSGVFLLDTFQGQPQLVALQQAEGDINRDTKGNIFRGALNPVASAKQTIELDGEHATVRAHAAIPSIYINVEDEAPEAHKGETDSAKLNQPNLDAPRPEQDPTQQKRQQPQQPEQAVVPFDRFRIVRTKVKNGKRIVGDLKRSVTGKVSQDQSTIKTTIDRVNGGWLKLTPIEDLAPGEYVVVEMKGSEGMNLYVWDFSVDPKGAANANPWKPEVKPVEAPKPQ